jgi:hypothetical protein
MKHHLYTCEMMDDTILDCTKHNREQAKIGFLFRGEPKAVIMLEVAQHKYGGCRKSSRSIDSGLEKQFWLCLPKIYGADIDKINELRKAGLGLWEHCGDDKAADSIKNTAVELSDLPQIHCWIFNYDGTSKCYLLCSCWCW